MLLPPANEVWGKVIFLHPFVPLFTEGGQPASVHAGTPSQPPWDHAPPRTMHPTPSGTMHPPSAQSMLGDTVNARTVRILLECNFVMMAPPLDSTSPYNPPPLHSNPPLPLRTLNVFSHSAKAKTKVEK